MHKWLWLSGQVPSPTTLWFEARPLAFPESAAFFRGFTFSVSCPVHQQMNKDGLRTEGLIGNDPMHLPTEPPAFPECAGFFFRKFTF